MSDTAADTITLEQTIRIAASPEVVGTDAEVETKPGGLLRVGTESGPVMRGAFTELEPPHRLVFTFGWEHNAPGEPLAVGITRVEVTMKPAEGDMPATHAPDHEKGWSYFVGERLVAAAGAA